LCDDKPMSWTIRQAQDTDLSFLGGMLYEAANWRPENRAADKNDVLGNPHVALYLAGWGRPGDTALLAEDEHDQPAGAAWFRFFSRDAPGYGFIDETVPELLLAVRAELRGRGIGASLLNALVDIARDQGVRGLSLSVEEDNPALRLYERIEFRSVEKRGNGHTMGLDLESGPPKERLGDDR
jgi:ribosomal protein S18 acetylase RimI-like enzyme